MVFTEVETPQRSVVAVALHYYWNELAVIPLERSVGRGDLQVCSYSSNDSGEDDGEEESEEMGKPEKWNL